MRCAPTVKTSSGDIRQPFEHLASLSRRQIGPLVLEVVFEAVKVCGRVSVPEYERLEQEGPGTGTLVGRAKTFAVLANSSSTCVAWSLIIALQLFFVI
jgi:hypothetical protein